MLPEKTDLRHAHQAVRTGGKPRKWNVGETSVWLFLFIYLIAVAYPLLWMAVSAFKSSDEIFEHSWSPPLSGIPKTSYPHGTKGFPLIL